MIAYIGVWEGILLGGRKNFALKTTICLETNFLNLIRMKPETSCKYVLYTVEFVYNGFVCNVNSPMTLHFVRLPMTLHGIFYMCCISIRL